MFSPARVTPGPDASAPPGQLGAHERAVLFALAESVGKVISRRALARRVGIAELGERRCDSLLVSIRRVLGPDAIITVRGRGWMLQRSAFDALQELLDEAS